MIKKSLLFCIFAVVKTNANDFGSAFINMIRNNSRFDIELDLADKSTDPNSIIFQKVSSDSTFKFKFLDVKLGQERFLKLQKDQNGVYRLISVELEKEAGIFKVKKDYQNRSFVLISDDQSIFQSEDLSVQSMPGGGSSGSNLWEIIGRDFDLVRIKSHLGGGFLGRDISSKNMLSSHGDFLNFVSLSQSSLKPIFDSYLKSSPDAEIPKTSLLVSEKQISSLRVRSFLFGAEVGTYLSLSSPKVESDNSEQKILQSVQAALQSKSDQKSDSSGSKDKSEMLGKLKSAVDKSSMETQSVYLQYGDIIKLVSLSSGLFLATNQDLPTLSSSPVQDSDYWTVKSDKDVVSTNYSFGQFVKNGAPIKLQNVSTGKFLSASTKDSSKLETSIDDNNPGALFLITDSENKEYVLLGNKLTMTVFASQGVLSSGKAIKSGLLLSQDLSISVPKKATDFTAQPSIDDQMTNKKDSQEAAKNTSDSIFCLAEIKRSIKHLSSQEGFSVGFSTTKALFDSLQAQEFSMVPVDLKKENVVISGATFNREVNVSEQEFAVSGFGYNKIPNFSASSFVKLPMMRSKGSAWISYGFDPGLISFCFIARTNENGIIEVNLGNNLSKESLYKLQIGTNSGKTALLRRESDGVILAQENLPEGLNIFGKLLQVWVSFKNGFFVCGFGAPGKNLILSGTDDKYYEEPIRIGFSSGNDFLEIAELKEASMVGLSTPEVFDSTDCNIVLSGDLQPIEKSLKGDCFGTISFDLIHEPNSSFSASFYADKDSWLAKKEPNLTISLDTSDFNDVIINFTPTCSHKKSLAQDAKCQSCTKKIRQTVKYKDQNRKKIFVSFSKDQFMFGLNDYLKPFCIVKNKLIEKKCGFVAVKGKGTNISNISNLKPLELSLSPVSKGSKIADSYDLIMVMPFWYSITQDGPTISFKDMISGKNYYMGRANSQGVKYTFILAIDEKGLPAVTWLFAPEDSTKTALMIASSALTGASESLRQASGKFESTGGAEDKAELPALIATAGSIIGTTIAAGVSIGAAALKTEATLGRNKFVQVSLNDKKGQPKLNVTTVGGKVGDEKIELKDVAVSSITPEILQQKAKVEDLVKSSMVWQPTDKEKFVSLLSSYMTTVGMINHPETIKDPATKANVLSMINALIFANYRFGDTSTRPLFIKMLSMAIDNQYLLTDLERKTTAKNWQVAIANLLTKDFKNMGSITIPPLVGFPCKIAEFKQTNIVKASFSINTQSDGSIYFMGKNKLGSIGIGIRISKNDLFVDYWSDKLYNLTKKSFAKDLLSEVEPSFYKVSYDSGLIIISKKSKDVQSLQKYDEIFRWLDPYPVGNITAVAFAGSDSEVFFDNISIDSNDGKSALAVEKVLSINTQQYPSSDPEVLSKETMQPEDAQIFQAQPSQVTDDVGKASDDAIEQGVASGQTIVQDTLSALSFGL